MSETRDRAAGAAGGPAEDDDLRPEYDFSDGVRGKYAGRFTGAARTVTLDPDVARVFPDAESVNEALRALVAIVERRRQT